LLIVTPRRAAAVADAPGDAAGALREHLLATTERLLADRPATALTTRAIARRAGVSDGVLYNYFSDKDELVVSALVRRFARLLERFEAVRPDGKTLEDRLLAYARALLELHAGALPLARSLAGDGDLLARFMRELHRAPLGGPRILAPLVELLRAEGVPDPDAAADLLVGAIAMRVATTLLGGSTTADVERLLPRLVGALVDGLAPR
jgi:AcrR family transcriptional regulator